MMQKTSGRTGNPKSAAQFSTGRNPKLSILRRCGERTDSGSTTGLVVKFHFALMGFGRGFGRMAHEPSNGLDYRLLLGDKTSKIFCEAIVSKTTCGVLDKVQVVFGFLRKAPDSTLCATCSSEKARENHSHRGLFLTLFIHLISMKTVGSTWCRCVQASWFGVANPKRFRELA